MVAARDARRVAVSAQVETARSEADRSAVAPFAWRKRSRRDRPAGAEMRGFPSPVAILPGVLNPIWIRTAGEGDVEELAFYFRTLSCTARYYRFMGAVGDLSARARECLLPPRRPDFFTLVAEWREHGRSAMIGEA